MTRRLGAAAVGVGVVLVSAACGTAPAYRPAQGTGHSSVRGTVIGRLVRAGGPLGPDGQQPAEHPLRGLIQFTGAGQDVVSVRTGRSGTFSVSLPPGTYRVIGRSPEIGQVSSDSTAGQRVVPCSQPLSVAVTAHRTVRITLTCVVP